MSNNQIPVIGGVLTKIFGSRNERFVKRYTMRVEQIRALEPETRRLTDEQIRGKLGEFRDRLAKGEKIDDVTVEAFAVAREAMDRNVGIRNIFNPEHAERFDASRLPGTARAMYEAVRAEIEGLEPAAPEGRFLGNPGPVPAFLQVDIPPALYEAVRELYKESKPPFRARPFDVQLIGAMVLAGGKIAEMKTGEGKTIVGPLACYLAAIQRQQVHVVTVNDYLVQRDRDWTAPFFQGLGLTVGAIHPQHMQPEEEKRRMYRCDVVYGTTSEFGFDYLRDNMKRQVEQQVQRKRQFAIVDEVDSILIDEARTPLIISGLAHEDRPRYEMADQIARHLVEKQRPWQELEDEVRRCKETIKGLEGDIRQSREKERIPELQRRLEEAKKRLPELERKRDEHVQYYEVEPERKAAYLTHEGTAEAQRFAKVGSFYVDENMDLPHLVQQAVRAHAVYQRDRDYIVMPSRDPHTGQTVESVIIVDTNTGRPMVGRQWSDGLHQAVEAKEGVQIKQETQTVATVTIQNFYKMYKRLSGMTGTADTEAQEFHDIYKMDVVSIPTNRPVARRDYDDLMYLRAKDKWDAITDEIKRFHDVGRPVLVGTTSVEKSEMLSQMLQRRHGVKHEVLNAKQHEREAHIVEGAGQLGAVMIATNMAGRGTDIKLGQFTREQLADHWLRRGLASRGLTPEASEEELRENIFRKVAQTELKEDGVSKRDAESMDFAELELRLLRRWAALYTWVNPKSVEKMGREELMEELDAGGRFLLHRVRWFADVEDMGGLHVVGTERHESRRIDNQLRGRAGRQGDKGSSRFFISLEDDLMKMFAGETTMRLLSRMGMKEGDAIEHPWLSKNVEKAQRKVEERNFQIRKNILEYDEIMEVQRQRFYGLRQRVLEGRQVKELIFEYIEDAVDDAIEEMLDKDYPAICAAEFARQRLDCSVPHDRLKGKSLDEMEMAIRRLAKEDARAMIDVTLGEYMPMEGSEVSVDFDSAGLVAWAKSRFGVEIDAAELREGGAAERRHVQDRLEEAAYEKIDEADLSGLSQFVEPDYGARMLADWVRNKFTIEVTAEEIRAAEDRDGESARELILARARELYRTREARLPVDFVMDMTMVLARQDPQGAFRSLGDWARRRFGLELSPEEIRSTPPQKIRERLLEASEKFVEEGVVEKEVAAAVAIADDDALDAHLKQRFGAGLTERMRYLDESERPDAVRARVENLLRGELLMFERGMLLDTLDSLWKDHLYAMDQLRDAIGFRAFSQQDPRIAYKREGARAFDTMMESVRDRVTDYVFKARVNPQAQMAMALGLGGAGGGIAAMGGMRPQGVPGMAGVGAGRPAAAPGAGVVVGGGGAGGAVAPRGTSGRPPARPFDPFAVNTPPRAAPTGQAGGEEPARSGEDVAEAGNPAGSPDGSADAASAGGVEGGASAEGEGPREAPAVRPSEGGDEDGEERRPVA